MQHKLYRFATPRQAMLWRSFSAVPEPASRPIRRATGAAGGPPRRTIGAFLVAVAVVALAGCVAAGPSAATTHPASSSLEPTGSSTETAPAAASGQPLATPAPSDASTAPTPTVTPGLVPAKADLSIKCGPSEEGAFPMEKGGSIYVGCTYYGDFGAILVVDATKGRVTKTLKLSRWGYLQAVDHGIWVSWSGVCAQPSCGSHIERLDPATGRVTLHLDDQAIAAAGLGYIWSRALDGSMIRIDVATLARTTIPFPYDWAVAACGSLFGVDAGGYHRLDLGTGALLSDIADSKGVNGLTDVNGQCWGVVTDNAQRRAQFVRIGKTAVDYRGPWIMGPTHAPTLQIIGSGFWLTEGMPSDYTIYHLQQVDPTTGNLLGTAWAVPGSLPEVVAAGGRIWRMDSISYALQRLTISSDPLATPPAP